MTVKDLIMCIDHYCGVNAGRAWDAYKNLDKEVMIVDDGMCPKYFAVESAMGSKFSKVTNDGSSYSLDSIFMLTTNLCNEVK